MFRKRMQFENKPGEGGGAGGGGEPPKPPATLEEAQKLIASLQGENTNLKSTAQQREQAYKAALAEAVSVQNRGQPDQNDQEEPDEEELDPELEKAVQIAEKRVAKRMAPVVQTSLDAADKQEFREYAASVGATDEELKRAEAIFKEYRQKGIQVNGQPVSRVLALNMAAAQLGFAARKKANGDRRTAEETREVENEDAFLEEGSRRSVPAKVAPPEKLSRKDRTDEYWEKRLDKDGGW